ncbi:MAG: alpha/beta hydrolase [Candidatus Eremiobacterota bacterium]
MLSRIFLHGLESSGRGRKAKFLRACVDGLLTPDFHGTLNERMGQLEPILAGGQRWMLIGSSFGGLMAGLWTVRHPERVERLILLAPALHRPDFAAAGPVGVPTLLVHGVHDTVVPPEPVERVARSAFSDLSVWRVDDDHRLIPTSEGMDWARLLDPALPRPWATAG